MSVSNKIACFAVLYLIVSETCNRFAIPSNVAWACVAYMKNAIAIAFFTFYLLTRIDTTSKQIPMIAVMAYSCVIILFNICMLLLYAKGNKWAEYETATVNPSIITALVCSTALLYYLIKRLLK